MADIDFKSLTEEDRFLLLGIREYMRITDTSAVDVISDFFSTASDVVETQGNDYISSYLSANS